MKIHNLEIIKLNKKIKNKNILENVSLELPKGSIFAFLGPNGAGKSTLINIILDLLKPTSGKIKLNNNKIGIVFQENTLDDELTIYENLLIRGSLYKIKKDKLNKNINKITNMLNMKEFINKKYKECSGGQKRISNIARSIIIEPDILILDEPTTALDPNIRKLVWDTIIKLNKEKNMTIFFSSHYLEEAYYANYICILNKGKLIFKGTKNNLLGQNGIKKLIINEKNNNQLEYKVNSIKEGIDIINKKNIYNMTSIKITDPSLDEIFINMTGNKNEYID